MLFLLSASLVSYPCCLALECEGLQTQQPSSQDAAMGTQDLSSCLFLHEFYDFYFTKDCLKLCLHN